MPAADPAPPPDVVEPDITVVLEMEGVSLGEMRGGFGVVESWPATDETEARQLLRVVLATYPDPCGALSGFYRDLAAAYEDEPYPSSSQWDQVLADANERFPSEPYDTLYLTYEIQGERPALIGEHAMTANVDPSGIVIEAGPVGAGTYERLYSLEGLTNVSGLDPFIGDGEATVAASYFDGEAQGTLAFSFEVPDCPGYLPAIRAYEDAQPDGCRGVSCG